MELVMMALVNTSVQPQFEGSVEIKGKIDSDFQGILTPEALRFLVKLHRNFNSRRGALLERRVEVQEKIDRGMTPDFLSETHEIRRSNWAIASIPPDLTDRRVEITGPVDRKMIINALNSGAQ